jgi:hypothetical protein
MHATVMESLIDPADSLECSRQSRYVVSKRCQRKWRADHINAQPFQRQNDVLPTGSVSPRPPRSLKIEKVRRKDTVEAILGPWLKRLLIC